MWNLIIFSHRQEVLSVYHVIDKKCVSSDLGYSWSRGRAGPRVEVGVEVEKVGLPGDVSRSPRHLTSMRSFTITFHRE